MLLIYGPYMPIRILEAIQDWKNQEKEHTVLIRKITPGLEPSFAQVLTEWEQVFAKTEETARGWLQSTLSNDRRFEGSFLSQIDQLLKAAVFQSEQFIQQLEYMKQYSHAMRHTSAVPTLCAHVVRESYVFVSVTKSLTSSPLAEAQAQAHAHAGGVRPNPVADSQAMGVKPTTQQTGSQMVSGWPTAHSNTQAGSEFQTTEGNAQASGARPLAQGNAQASGAKPLMHGNAQASGARPFVHGNAQASGAGPLMHGNAQASGAGPLVNSSAHTGAARPPAGNASPAGGSHAPAIATPSKPQAHVHAAGEAQPPPSGTAAGIRAVIGEANGPMTARSRPPEGGTAAVNNTPYPPLTAAGDPAGAAGPLASAAPSSEPLLRQAAPEQEAARPDNVYVPPGGHRLPPLPYPYNALEPYIDAKTMQIHHDIHHKTYVDDLNKAELALVEARRTGDFDRIKALSNELAFNGAGHYLHTIFWDIMNPKGGGEPQGDLRRQIIQDFGSYQSFKQQFSKAAEKVEGSGWAILVWSPRSRRLEILQAEKHQNLSQWDVVPLLVLDVWEHAYYLKHQNKRADYIKDWWNVVYWPAVNERYLKARQLKWTPY